MAHHNDYILLKFNQDDGTLTSTNKENIILLSKHFYGIYNRETKIDWNFINTIPHHETLYNISSIIQLNELYKAIYQLKWHKVPRRNGVLPNVIKALNSDHRSHLLLFIRYWMEYDYIEYKD